MLCTLLVLATLAVPEAPSPPQPAPARAPSQAVAGVGAPEASSAEPPVGEPRRLRYRSLPPAPPPIREGFTIGFAFGPGLARYDRDGGARDVSSGALVGSLRVGGMLEENLAALAQIDGAQFFHEQREYQTVMVSVTLQVFPADRLWLKVGAGFAFTEIRERYYDVLYDRTPLAEHGGLGGHAAIGFELIKTRTPFALDLELFAVGSKSGDLTMLHGGLGLGFQWY